MKLSSPGRTKKKYKRKGHKKTRQHSLPDNEIDVISTRLLDNSRDLYKATRHRGNDITKSLAKKTSITHHITFAMIEAAAIDA